MAENTTEFGCATCGLRQKAEENPKGFMSRLWRWHTTWCPGWKKYQQHLAEEEAKAKRSPEAE